MDVNINKRKEHIREQERENNFRHEDSQKYKSYSKMSTLSSIKRSNGVRIVHIRSNYTFNFSDDANLLCNNKMILTHAQTQEGKKMEYALTLSSLSLNDVPSKNFQLYAIPTE